MAFPSNNPTNSPPPTTTTTTNATAASAPSPRTFLHHQRPHQPQFHPQQPIYHRHVTPTPQPTLTPRGYPVSSSGRGFRPRAHHIATSAAGSYGQLSRQHPAAGVRAFGYPPVQFTRPNQLQHVSNMNASSLMGSSTEPMPTLVRAAPLSSVPVYQKGVPSPAPVHDGNAYKDLRDRGDNLLMVRDRKVKVSDSSSLYAACRSWLRNGLSEETQPQYLDGIRLLPKPSPPPVPDAHSPAEQEPIKEEEEEDSVEHLSPSDLLQRHVKRAKRVRARLRDERLQRIARYKTRLALLLPPLIEQPQFKNEAEDGN